MSDRERELPLLRQAFNPGRANFEQPGQGGNPLELEREWKAQLGITLSDVSAMQPGLQRGYEISRQFTAAVALQFSAVSFMCPDGFYLEYLRHVAAGAALTITVGPPLTFATLAGTFNRNGFPVVVPRLVAIQGNLAAGIGSQFVLPNNQVFNAPRLWIPPNFFLNLIVDTANIQSDNNLILSGTTAT